MEVKKSTEPNLSNPRLDEESLLDGEVILP